MRIMSYMNKNLRDLFRNTGGNSFAIFAMATAALIGASGGAIDMGRAQMLQAKLSSALDAAGLAAGASANTVDIPTEARAYFDANFNASQLNATVVSFTAVPSNNNAIITLTATVTEPTTFMRYFGKRNITVSATSEITRSNKGMELVLVLDNTGSMSQTLSGGTMTKLNAVKQASKDLLNILYGKDPNTGIDRNTQDNLYVGLVPFGQVVNIGTSHSSWMDTAYNNTLDFGPRITGTTCPTTSGGVTGTYSATTGGCRYTLTGSNNSPTWGMTAWDGCVMERAAPYDTTSGDTVPVSTNTSTLFRAYRNPYAVAGSTPNSSTTASTVSGNGCSNSQSYANSWRCTQALSSPTRTTTYYDYSNLSFLSDNKGPNAVCPAPVQSMVKEKSTVFSAIDAMVAGGDTDINLGLVWGWRMLSPNWRNKWGGQMDTNSLPLDYNTDLMQKVIVLMTDGDNQYLPNNYTAYQYLANNVLGTTRSYRSPNPNPPYLNSAEDVLDKRALAICTELKKTAGPNRNVIIYTIAFGSTISTYGQSLLQSCASKPEYYFYSPTNNDLTYAFRAIGDSLANLRISK